ncbi:MAG: fumarylacetoacetate hydrolase family protein [Syntrophomonadaceae bacterium]|nr:fumarylacetoacetate hydrolase family protein [Syntrophomonadaceae bacterium]
MEFIRFFASGQNEKYGILRDDKVYVVTGDIFTRWEETGESLSFFNVNLLAPCKPSKIICIGLNYKDHAEEFNLILPEEPVVFLKPPSAVIGPGDEIIKPLQCKRLDYEAELAIVIGRKARNVDPSKAQAYIFGYACGNDVTARDRQPKDGQWTLAKSFDTFCPLGPKIVTDLDASKLAIKCYVNGHLRQNSNTAQMIFDPSFLVSYVSKVMTLFPGDIILTGTPSGVGKVEPGDRVAVEIEHLGRLENPIAKE